jgi:hypothetical protein
MTMMTITIPAMMTQVITALPALVRLQVLQVLPAQPAQAVQRMMTHMEVHPVEQPARPAQRIPPVTQTMELIVESKKQTTPNDDDIHLSSIIIN